MKEKFLSSINELSCKDLKLLKFSVCLQIVHKIYLMQYKKHFCISLQPAVRYGILKKY